MCLVTTQFQNIFSNNFCDILEQHCPKSYQISGSFNPCLSGKQNGKRPVDSDCILPMKYGSLELVILQAEAVRWVVFRRFFRPVRRQEPQPLDRAF